MTLEQELKLSYYRELGSLDERHGVRLVQHVETRQVFVEKTLKVYDRQVFQYLADHPVPGTPRVQELVEDGGELHLIEEYISGETLRARLDREGPMEETAAAELVGQICAILTPLHRLEPPIVHRDIKPENLILTYDGRVVLVDFNSAKETRSDRGQDTVLIGTVGYAAPEQYGFSSSQPTADIYALGVLLNELLTGHLPGEGVYQGRLGAVIRRCIQMDPSRRYSSAEALQRALGRYGACVSAPPPEGLRSWLPPGFRTLRLERIVLAVMWYGLIFGCAVSMQSSGASGLLLTLMRATVLLIGLGETFWLGNYRRCWEKLPLSASPRPLVKAAGVVLWAVVLLVTVLVLMPTLASLLVPAGP